MMNAMMFPALQINRSSVSSEAHHIQGASKKSREVRDTQKIQDTNHELDDLTLLPQMSLYCWNNTMCQVYLWYVTLLLPLPLMQESEFRKLYLKVPLPLQLLAVMDDSLTIGAHRPHAPQSW